MASANEPINDLLKPNKVLFGVNSSGRILRLDTECKTYPNSRGIGTQQVQGWKVRYFSYIIDQSTRISQHYTFIIYCQTKYFFLITQELSYLGIEFKRASAARNLLWAVGGDHQLYVMVFGVEVPIRVKEVSKKKYVMVK